MVDFSLKKARNNWKNGTGPSLSKPKSTNSPIKSKPKSDKKNPYSDIKVALQYSQLPTIDAKERTKVASSMQRRLSVHQVTFVPPKLDYSMPLPSMDINQQSENVVNIQSIATPDNQKTNVPRSVLPNKGASPMHVAPPTVMKSFPSDILQATSLRSILADPNFNAKTFVHDNLGEATTMEIDRFTSNLSSLSLDVQEEVKQNVNRSYKEILTVNTDLNVASLELKNLRKGINDLFDVMQQFMNLAEKRLQVEQGNVRQSLSDSQNYNNPGLLPPMRAASRLGPIRDRSSVLILEKIRDAELTTLFKNVEGAHKLIGTEVGRHILLESDNWVELNRTTLKPLRNIKIYILNDMIFVAHRTRDKQTELIAAECMNLRDTSVSLDDAIGSRLAIQFGPSNKTLFQNRNPQECLHLLDVFRRAKDDLRDILQAEKKNSKKLKESFSYLSSQQTPGRENVKSPVKNQRRSMGNTTPGRNSEIVDQYLLQTVTMSLHSRTHSRDVDSLSKRLMILDELIEEMDIQLVRLKHDSAIDILLNLESETTILGAKVQGDDEMLHSLIELKINQRRETLVSSLSQSIVTTFEIGPLTSAISTLIKLGLYEEGLDLFLQNRSNVIQDLILQIGSYDNPTNYLIQIAVIRFQTIKKTVLNFQSIFRGSADKFSSIIVSWCRNEVESHFKLIDKQLLNDEMLTPESIKSSRKQIDDLKSVGLDFVYKLDEFIKKNNSKIK